MAHDTIKSRCRFPRVEMLFEVSYPEREDLAADYLTDLGRGGMFFCTTVPFQLRETVQLRAVVSRVARASNLNLTVATDASASRIYRTAPGDPFRSIIRNPESVSEFWI